MTAPHHLTLTASLVAPPCLRLMFRLYRLMLGVLPPSLTRRYSYRPTIGYPENLTMSSPMPAKARISTSIGGAATAMSECEGSVGTKCNKV